MKRASVEFERWVLKLVEAPFVDILVEVWAGVKKRLKKREGRLINLR